MEHIKLYENYIQKHGAFKSLSLHLLSLDKQIKKLSSSFFDSALENGDINVLRELANQGWTMNQSQQQHYEFLIIPNTREYFFSITHHDLQSNVHSEIQIQNMIRGLLYPGSDAKDLKLMLELPDHEIIKSTIHGNIHKNGIQLLLNKLHNAQFNEQLFDKWLEQLNIVAKDLSEEQFKAHFFFTRLEILTQSIIPAYELWSTQMVAHISMEKNQQAQEKIHQIIDKNIGHANELHQINDSLNYFNILIKNNDFSSEQTVSQKIKQLRQNGGVKENKLTF